MESSTGAVASGSGPLTVLVAARDEADRIGETVSALNAAFPGSRVWVADDASGDGTGQVASSAGAMVVGRGRPVGKGGNVTACAEQAIAAGDAAGIVLLCDGDLGGTADRLGPLVAAVESGECDLAVADFARREGGGFGVALGFAAWAIRSRSGFEASAPISGQRAMSRQVLDAVLPFAPSYGMETAMTIDAVRSGFRVGEYPLDLSHRATGRDPAGFLHRFRQLVDFVRAWWSRR